ncbi:hypothetical protein [Micromonospora eburnea]|uniref:PknH-like extracellular domain-containing protein n=1 Tax=Micromonospora eburnea TaxID=227316 RepID=A0A1C6UU69_9ACTN|nr:hypothetical protein [Micromonospora eburnea]SCL57587.1 hypothetical protein GA0070604_3651 [Micromonospora eburnea]
MRNKRTVVTLAAVALAALTTLFLAGNGAASAGDHDTTAAGPMHFTTDELRQLLNPADAQRGTASSVEPVISIAEAIKTGQFESGPGITSEPKACLNMTDALGDLRSIEGFMLSGERSEEAAPDSYQRYFMTAVFQIPGGADAAVDKVTKVLRTCSAGTVTLDSGNGDPLKGTISYAEHPAPSLDGARTFASTLTTVLPVPDASRTNAEPIVAECDAQLTLTANGDLLIWSVEPTEQLATDSVSTVYDRAVALS